MKVFVFESLTGGGHLDNPVPSPSLCGEGAAMLAAMVEDFSALDGVTVWAMRDFRLRRAPWPQGAQIRWEEPATAEAARRTFDTLARQADWTLVIAPELEGELLGWCQRAEAAEGRLLGPSPAVVALASDKEATCRHLAAAGVPVPAGMALRPGQPVPRAFGFPAVVKPCLGAGSEAVRMVADAQAAEKAVARLGLPCRLERFCAGQAASVAVLCGPGVCRPLLPCTQRLSRDGRFRYLGGTLPLPPPLARRAVRLARRAVASLPQPTGFVGVDLVLGADPRGREDVVIEINPRLTTSYIGLRRAAASNLAGAMLAAAQGRRCRLCFRRIYVQFTAKGQTKVRHSSGYYPG